MIYFHSYFYYIGSSIDVNNNIVIIATNYESISFYQKDKF